MKKTVTLLVGLVASGILFASSAEVQAGYGESWPKTWRHGKSQRPTSFKRIATIPNYLNNASFADETVSEIVAATKNGRRLVYTDGELGELGIVDISNPKAPAPLGKVVLGGEPTSVAVRGNRYALVGVNTSASLTNPSGHLAVVNLYQQEVVGTLDLGGQPDSVAISPDGRYAAMAIENERDEDVVVDGEEGGLPQAPAGFLAIVDLRGHNPGNWQVRTADLSALSDYAPTDPEPEFVDINSRNQAVVSMQENNHIAIVDLRSGQVVSDFPAGTQSLDGVDATEDDIISLTESLVDVPREPDAVTWLRVGRRRLIGTANEGDLFGGSRGFSLFDTRGNLVFDAGSSYDEIAVRHGHYPEGRSENKGSEPESIEYARFGHKDYLFVGSERGSFVAVYELSARAEPEFLQILPAPLGPEGMVAIPSRNLLVVSGEEDDPEFGVRSTMMVYKLGRGEATYPQLVSGDDEFGKPIAWSALSGMTVLPGSDDQLLGVWDSFYAESRIFSIDASSAPAVITAATTIVGGSGNFDPEGIVVAPDGSYWIASEGNRSGSRPNRLLQTSADGTALAEVGLPLEIEACRAASATTGSLGAGFEGVTTRPIAGGYELLVAQQRGWNYTTDECEALDDDAAAMDPTEPSHTRIWSYNPTTQGWGHYSYELEALPPSASWVGLSEISSVPGGYVVVERDNRTGDWAELKTLAYFPAEALDDGIVTSAEKTVYDVLPALLESDGWVSDKPEGVAVGANGSVYLVTDNDGVDDWSGETWFLNLGNYQELF